jgi:predicted transcriptional regulator
VRRNESKKLVLESLQVLEKSVTATELSNWLEQNRNVNMTGKAASMELLRLFRNRLVSRRNGRYTITERGRKRLAFLSGS